MSVKVANLGTWATVADNQTSADGTTKFLLKLRDGNLIECVLLVQDYGNTVCVSSQVGCKMGCAFCASGKCGFVRDLVMEEMLVQILICNKHLKTPGAGAPPPLQKGEVSHIVIMGCGEPFDNFDNVVAFLRAVDIGARKISVSTCGLPDGIRRFADLGAGYNLCISLHAPNDALRAQIMPIAKRYKIKEVMDAVRYFFNKTKRRVIFEYSLIDGVNCSVECANELADLLHGARISYHVNLIKLNKGGGVLNPPDTKTAMIFMDTLIKRGVSCTMRKGKGQDIMAACGQLRAKGGASDTNQ